MDQRELLQYLLRVIASVIRYALLGSVLAAAVGMLILALTAVFGSSTGDSAPRLLDVAANYAVFGAFFGGLLGLIRGLLARSQA